ncbi:RcnB family protein [Massilia yuzhufengensis]|uniref:Regulator RcnB of Ni and Co efflux n=1 Tax=Massilia yuzhufengensis TaxID=1164594 RepID=A0A1I1FV46_9BURK|nr:RcnB family protein [Massilia yuzhufengensis]SFC02912.1 regulator RcnB of Ni and Co efflux [Massilia yuzhufengensis]
MNKYFVPALVAAVLAGGAAAQVQQRGEQEARAVQAKQVAKAGRYRSVEASGQLKRGEQLPPRYRTHHYVVENWQAHRLSEPPRGHQWVQAGSDYALVAIATGVVTEVLVGQ